jgi:poly-gamma-glutamate synthesis protein (capsule biosynthesis protein)
MFVDFMRTTLPIVFLILFCYLISEPIPPMPSKKNLGAKDSLIYLSITTVGDLMCHSSQYQYAKNANGSYDFSPVYEQVKEYLSAADLTIANLETVLAGNTKSFSGYPQFNSPNEYVDALKSVGFDVFFTTNNHSYDQGDAGVLRTLDELAKRKIPAIGTFYSQKDRDSVRVFDIKGFKIGILAYTQFSNITVPESKKFLVNHIDSALIAKDVQQARSKGAEIILANVHWGAEYQRFPNDYQKNIAKYLANLGVDIIFGEHPHVMQPISFLKSTNNTARIDSCLVAYSLGNFISAQYKRYTDAGVMLTVKLVKNLKDNKIKISSIDYVPTWVFKGTLDEKMQYKILPAFLAEAKEYPLTMRNLVPPMFNSLSAIHLQKMQQAGQDSKEILTYYTKNLKNVIWKRDSSIDSIRHFPLTIHVLPDSIFVKKLDKKKIKLR